MTIVRRRNVICQRILFISFMLSACGGVQDNGRHIMQDRETEDFNPMQITCGDESTEEMQKAFDAILHNPNSDLYWTAHIDEILYMARKSARQGNLTALRGFGELKTDYLIEEHLHNNEGHHQSGNMPESEYRDSVVAITYLYIANEKTTDPKEKNRFSRWIQGLPEHDIKFPPQWIAKAKANAEAWQSYCLTQGVDVTSPHFSSPTLQDSH